MHYIFSLHFVSVYFKDIIKFTKCNTLSVTFLTFLLTNAYTHNTMSITVFNIVYAMPIPYFLHVNIIPIPLLILTVINLCYKCPLNIQHFH